MESQDVKKFGSNKNHYLEVQNFKQDGFVSYK